VTLRVTYIFDTLLPSADIPPNECCTCRILSNLFAIASFSPSEYLCKKRPCGPGPAPTDVVHGPLRGIPSDRRPAVHRAREVPLQGILRHRDAEEPARVQRVHRANRNRDCHGGEYDVGPPSSPLFVFRFKVWAQRIHTTPPPSPPFFHALLAYERHGLKVARPVQARDQTSLGGSAQERSLEQGERKKERTSFRTLLPMNFLASH